MVVVLVAEPCANTPKEIFSLCMGTHRYAGSPTTAGGAAGSPPADSVARRDEAVSRETLSAGSQHSAHICLSLLTQARIPS